MTNRDMNSSEQEIGIIGVFIKHLEVDAIPRALAIKKRIDNSESLNQLDMLFFEEEISYASSIMHLIEKHPEYQDLVTKIIHLYHEVTEQSLKNESQQR